MAMRQRVTLIQGPPGTGKTYVGCYIIARMLAAKPDLKVLCLSYTNHSVDDFLESLLKCGITNLTRIGKRSTSTTTLQYTLDTKCKNAPKDKWFNARFGRCKTSLDMAEERATEATRKLNNICKRNYKKMFHEMIQYLENTGNMYGLELQLDTSGSEDGTSCSSFCLLKEANRLTFYVRLRIGRQ